MQNPQKKLSTGALAIVADQQIFLAKEAFSKFGDVQLVEGRSIDQQMIKNADVLLVRSVTKVNEALLKHSKIQFVGSATSGIDHIDTDYLQKSDITFSYALGSNARSVAEYVLSVLLLVAERQGFDLIEKTVGIIGCGQVGSRVKRFMDAIGATCLVNDPPLAAKISAHSYVDLNDVLQADIISLHIPLTTETEFPTNKLVDNNFLNQLKSDVIFINTSRGEVVDEAALLSFRKTNPAATLILDVWRNEPKINMNLLKETFIATPHIAGYSYDGKLKATQMLIEALNDYMGERLLKADALNYQHEQTIIHANTIQLAVLQSYDVRCDAMALIRLNDMQVEERAIYFDSLRKNYPLRREFKNKVIQATKMNDELRQQLQKLGFKVQII